MSDGDSAGAPDVRSSLMLAPAAGARVDAAGCVDTANSSNMNAWTEEAIIKNTNAVRNVRINEKSVASSARHVLEQ